MSGAAEPAVRRRIRGGATRPRRPLAAAFALACALFAPAARAAVLTVDDPDDPGTVGDALLSVGEAIRVATGRLAPGALSGAEQARVVGTPGAAAADTIRFAVARVAVAGDGTAEILPPLDGPGDAIDGGGAVTLSAAGAAVGPASWGLRIMADGVAVDGVAFEDFPGTTLLVTPAAPAGVVTGTRIRGNRFTRPGVDAVRIVGGSLLTGGGGVDDTVVDGNTFEAGTPDNLVNGLTPAAINLFGAYLPVPGTVSGVRVTATTISHNAIRDIYYGVYARAADGPGTMRGNTIDGLTLDRNTCERVSDGCLVMAPTHVWGAGLSSDNALRNVRVTGNTFAGRAPGAPEYLGGAVFVSGGFLASCFDTTGTPTSLRDVASGVEITNNVVADRAPYGIFVQAAHSCGGAGGSLTDSVLEDVLVAGNLVRNSITGVSLQAASVIATGAGLTAARNTLRGVAVAGNTFEANSSTAVEVLGAYASFFGGRTGRTTDNVVRDVLVEANVMTGNRHGLSAIGAIAASPAEEVARNAVSGLRVTGNRVAGTWTAGMLLQAGNATQGRAGDNVLEAVELSDNVIEAVSNVGILVMASFEGGGGRAEGNVIQAPLLARNQLRGVTRGEVFSGSGIALQGDPGNAVRAALLEANVVDGVAGHGIELYRTEGHTLVRNRVSDYGRKPFFGKKRRNTLVDNVFPKKRKRRR